MEYPVQPEISVIVPTYNNEAYLKEALMSVLAQTHRSFEVVVVDDGSTDASAEIVKGLQLHVRYSRQSNAGIGAARNAGVRLARGNLFAFLDADDRMRPRCLETLHSTLLSHGELDMAFAHVTEFLSPEHSDRTVIGVREPFERVPGKLPTNMLVRRDAFFRVGMFTTDRSLPEGLDWYLRARQVQLSDVMLPDVLWERRLHEGNHGHRLNYTARLPSILKQALNRNRRLSTG